MLWSDINMIKFKYLMRIIIGGIIFGELFTFTANAGSWVSVDNSWRYYSDVQTGWYKSNGYWYYNDDKGIMKTGWVKSEGNYYYLDLQTGKMLIGWIQDKGNWYYLNSDGKMVTGWLEYNGNLYYLNVHGAMVKDVYIGAYYLGPDGAWREEHQHCR